MHKYILIGIPHCGKTTLGRKVAEVLQLPFFDTDEMVKEVIDISDPREIFRSFFSGRFLKEQLKAVIKLAMMDGAAIIATGAEVALAPECSKLIKAMGTIIHILRDPELAEMSLVSREHRMFLKEAHSNTEIDMSKESIRLYAQEYSSYEALADLSLENNGTEEEGLEKLVALIKSANEKQSYPAGA